EARAAGLRVVAVDIPSGIDPDSGEVPGEAVWADATVTLGGIKQGLLRFPAAARVGRLMPRAIDIPESAEIDLPYGCLDEAELGRGAPTTAFVAELLRLRPRDHGLVVDADGLVALADIGDWWTGLGPNAILTPHAGELERLVGHALGEDEPLWVHASRLAQQW